MNRQNLTSQTKQAVVHRRTEASASSIVPQIPTFAQTRDLSNPSALFKDLLEKSPGIVIGEEHGEPSAQKLMSEQMANFRRSGVKILFLEHFTRDAQPILNRFNKTGDTTEGRAYLSERMGSRYNEQYVSMITSANENGISVVGIDEENRSSPSKRSYVNTSWAKVVRETMEAYPGYKYVMLVGSAHTYKATSPEDSFPPGIDRLLNIPSVDVDHALWNMNPTNGPIKLKPGDDRSADYIRDE